jgi:hypothetical protein
MPTADIIQQAQQFVSIDPLKLDVECVNLPSDYLKFSHLAAEARHNLECAEAALKEKSARLADDIRANPGNYGLEKITEAAITATIQVSAAFITHQKAVLEARHQKDLAECIVWAMDMKKRSLTNLVELHGMGWSATVKVSEKGREAVDNLRKTGARKNFDREDVVGKRNQR